MFFVYIFSLTIILTLSVYVLINSLSVGPKYSFKKTNGLSTGLTENTEIKQPKILPDTISPEIKIIHPGNIVFSKNSVLKIYISDENLNPEIRINDQNYTTDNSGFILFPFKVIEGKNNFLIQAQDMAGNKKDEKLELDLKIALPKRVPILMYHHINSKLVETNSVEEKLFEEQLDWLKTNGFHSISFAQLDDYLINGLELPDKPIILSFDDGYIDNYSNAFKILKSKNMIGSFGVITSLIGTNAHGARFYMSWEELKEMDQAGMELVNHSYSHKYMPKISDLELEQELLESKKILEKFLNKKIETFVYPTGGYSSHVIAKLKEYGYRSARISGNYKKMSLENIYTLPVIKVVRGATAEQLGKLILAN